MQVIDINAQLNDAELLLSKNEYVEVERRVNSTLQLLHNIVPRDLNEHKFLLSRGYRILCESLWRRGLSLDALSYGEIALSNADNPKEKILIIIQLSRVKHALGNLSESLEFGKTALCLATQFCDESIIATIHHQLSNVYMSLTDYNNSLSHCKKSLEIVSEKNDISSIGKCLISLGLINFRNGDFIQATEYFQQAFILATETQNKRSQIIALTNLGLSNKGMGNFNQALLHLEHSLDICEEICYEIGAASNLNNIASLYISLNNNPQAITILERALILAEKFEEKYGIAQICSNIGSCYKKLELFDLALTYLKRSAYNFQSIDNMDGYAHSLREIGTVYKYMKEYFLSLEYQLKALRIDESNDNKIGFTCALGNIGVLLLYVYLQQDSIVYNNDFVKLLQQVVPHDTLDLLGFTEYCLTTANHSFTQIGLKLEICNSHKNLSELYQYQHKMDEAFFHLSKYHQLYIEVQNEEVKKQADRFGWEQKLLEMEKQKEIEAIKNEAEKKILEETINFQQTSFEHQSRELKNTIEELVRKNSLLQHIQSDIKKIAPHTIREGAEHIKQLLDRVERNITPLESNQHLRNQLNDVHKDLMSNLHAKFPEITMMELKIAALLSMKLTSSNIAAALYLSKRTVESHRLSLRKKLGLGKDDDIYTELAKYMI